MQGQIALGRPALHISLPIKTLRTRKAPGRMLVITNTSGIPNNDLQEDPEAQYKRYGSNFGKRYLLQDVVDTAPRIRVRRAHDRARDQLADLAVLNERLANATGGDESEATVARQRLDYLKRRRHTWELVYQHVVREDALCTLAAIEEANRKVEEALSEESRERAGVGALKRQLQDLQSEVASAHSRLHLTQARVDDNLRRISELKQEAATLNAVSSVVGGGDNVSVGTPVAAPVFSKKGSKGSSAPPSPQGQAVSANQAANTPQSLRQRGLQSSLELEDELKNHWFAVHFSSRLEKDTLLPFELFDEPWVLFRDAEGHASCCADSCAHRACPLSLGKVIDGEIACAYHGWRFNGGGECTVMPSTSFCRGVRVTALPVVEVDGMVWVWPGWREAGPLPIGLAAPPAGYTIHAELDMEVPVEHGLLLENLLDLAHANFTHQSTFAKNWPVPDVVRFQASKVLGGSWQPYPIDMEFLPPCGVLSTIGLEQPGKIEHGARAAECKNHLHQLHVCLPARKGHTRLLYRMSLDFMGWAKYVPGIKKFWESIAMQVLGEDLLLVTGQQDRMKRGGDTWAHPVSYDKLAVRYRRWRNTVGAGGGNGGEGDGGECSAAERAAAAAAQASLKMDAATLFELDDEEELYVDQSCPVDMEE